MKRSEKKSKKNALAKKSCWQKIFPNQKENYKVLDELLLSWKLIELFTKKNLRKHRNNDGKHSKYSAQCDFTALLRINKTNSNFKLRNKLSFRLCVNAHSA